MKSCRHNVTALTKLHKKYEKVALFNKKLLFEKYLSKYIQLRSSFEDLVAIEPTVKTDYNLDARFKNYGVLKKEQTELNTRASY